MTTPTPRVDVCVIGAGVVGCAIARRLARTELSVLLLDAADDVGAGTSKANTAILHTGFDTVPQSLESTLVHEGYGLLSAYAEQAGIAVEPTGGLLVAWDDDQEGALPGLLEKALANGYRAAELVDAAEVRRREPSLGLGARSGLWIPGESIIDPWSVTLAYATEAVTAGADLSLGDGVIGVETFAGSHRLLLRSGHSVDATWVINAAGLGADDLDALFGHHRFTVTPRRGQLLVYDKLARPLLSSILLPVPTERTKGVLVSPTVWGNLLVGPTAEDLDDKTATCSTAEGIAALRAAAELLVPALATEEITAMYAGLRAATEHRDYQIDLSSSERYVCVGGIRSTGLTASLAIAEHVANLLARAGVPVDEREECGPIPVMPPLGEQQCRPLFDADKIATDPAYGRALCHCERVSEGEIRDAMDSILPPAGLGGLRRRTRAMNGRCQGFYCAGSVEGLFRAAADSGEGHNE